MKWLSVLWMGLTHNSDGSFSSTKFWQGFGYLVTTFVIVSLTVQGNMSAEYLLIYLAAVTSARGFQSYLVSKNQQGHTHEN